MKPQRPEQFGICSWSTHPKDPADLAGRMKELGLKRVQLALDPLRHNDSAWGDVQAVLKDQGLAICSGMFGCKGEDYSTLESIRATGGVVPDATWQDNWAAIQEHAPNAAKLGLTLVSTHAGFLPHDKSHPDFKKLVDRISQIAELFKKHSLVLVFETGQETAETLSAFLDALDKQGATNTGVNFDPANMILYDKGDPVESLKKLMPRVMQVHIKDAKRTTKPGTWGSEVAIGDGDVDWRGFLRALAEGDFEGNLVIEREAGEDRVGDVRKAIERLTKIMDELA